MKFKVKIIEYIEGEIEVEADSAEAVAYQLQMGHEEAGRIVEPMETSSMFAEIFDDKEIHIKSIKLI